MGVYDKLGKIILYVIRHAEVAEDKEGTMRGILNPALDPKGKRDAQSLVEYFKGVPMSFIATDDLKRTMQTAKPLAKAKGLDVLIDIDLRSWDVGTELEGEDIEDNKEDIEMLKTHPQVAPVAGQPWGDYGEQANRSFYRYADRAMGELDAGAVFVHGSWVQVIAHTLGLQEADAAYDSTPIEPAGVIGVFLTREGYRMKILKGEKETVDE
jgi:broad specificity phosphatase PhoE